jgi:hypothetical protein
VGEIAILITAQFTGAFLWFNVIGCLVAVLTGWMISTLRPSKPSPIT